MRIATLISAAALAMGMAGAAHAEDEIPDASLGLSPTSVFDTPVPEGYDYDGAASRIPLQSSDQAPVIPHEARAYEQITTTRNRCLRCHMEPDRIGAVLEDGEAQPMPADHYLQLPGDGVEARVDGGRWVCTQCHVAQADAPALVENTAVP